MRSDAFYESAPKRPESRSSGRNSDSKKATVIEISFKKKTQKSGNEIPLNKQILEIGRVDSLYFLRFDDDDFPTRDRERWAAEKGESSEHEQEV